MQIIEEINKLLPKYIDLLSELIKYQSIQYNEANIQFFIKSFLEKTLKQNAEIYYSREDLQSINLVSVLKGNNPKKYKSLILNAHSDITPVDGEILWKYPPFSAYIHNNLIYGRGSKDDKAGIAIILLVINVIKNLNLNIGGDIIIQFPIEDETSGNGTKTLIYNGYCADGAIIVDGTWNNRIIYSHIGQIYLDIFINNNHVFPACNCDRADDIIYLAFEFIKNVKAYVNALNEKYELFEQKIKPFFVNIGSFHSGKWHGATPFDIKIEMQIGFSHIDSSIIFNEINKMALNISKKIYVKKSTMETNQFIGDKNSDFIKLLQNTITKNSNEIVNVVPAQGYSDMRHFKTKNVCMYGPGKGANNHAIDEYYDLNDMPIVAQNIIEFCMNWCNLKKDVNNEK